MAPNTKSQDPTEAMGCEETKPVIHELNSNHLVITKTKSPLRKPPAEELGFGRCITDHMLKCNWRANKGWSPPEVVPSGPIMLHPFSQVLHYGIECYEGMKAYKDQEGNIRLFRPQLNMERLRASAERLCLPDFDGEELLKCIRALVTLDKDWIPEKEGHSLYLRPVYFSTTPWLGLSHCSEAMLFVLLSPVGPYFKTGMKPCTLLVDEKYIRAWPGGTGNVKFGGNYAPTIEAQIDASRRGCSQALFIYDNENKWVTEAGTMNIFFLWKKKDGKVEMVTPTLDDTCILPGITRRSVIELGKEWGEFEVTERLISFEEIMEAVSDGRLIESFGTGTAAVIQPFNGFQYKGVLYECPVPGDDCSLAQRYLNIITGIQTGKTSHKWSECIYVAKGTGSI